LPLVSAKHIHQAHFAGDFKAVRQKLLALKNMLLCSTA
jgi:hypothetical protein